MAFGKRYLGRVKVNKVDSNGNTITNLGKWLKQNPNKLYFDSLLEYTIYSYLKSQPNLNFKFHPDKVIFSEGYYTKEFFPSKISKKDVKTKKIKKGDRIPAVVKNIKIQEAGYTADFLVKHDNVDYYIETKGFADEAFKLRFKLFRKTLTKNQHAYVVKNLKELKELLNLII